MIPAPCLRLHDDHTLAQQLGQEGKYRAAQNPCVAQRSRADVSETQHAEQMSAASWQGLTCCAHALASSSDQSPKIRLQECVPL